MKNFPDGRTNSMGDYEQGRFTLTAAKRSFLIPGVGLQNAYPWGMLHCYKPLSFLLFQDSKWTLFFLHLCLVDVHVRNEKIISILVDRLQPMSHIQNWWRRLQITWRFWLLLSVMDALVLWAKIRMCMDILLANQENYSRYYKSFTKMCGTPPPYSIIQSSFLDVVV